MQGKSYDIEWSKEGHRIYPLIARTPPSTALETVAEHARNAAIQENNGLLHPSETKRVQMIDEEDENLKEIMMKDPVSICLLLICNFLSS